MMHVEPCFCTSKQGYKSIAYQGGTLWNSLAFGITVFDNYAELNGLLQNANRVSVSYVHFEANANVHAYNCECY